MKTYYFIYLFFISNFIFAQNPLVDSVWRLDKFIINGADVTYTDQTNHFHQIVFHGSGNNLTLVSGYCQSLFGLNCSFSKNQFSYGVFYSYGVDCIFNNNDSFLLQTNASFYFNNNINFNYILNELAGAQQLTITNSLNNSVIYTNVNLKTENIDKSTELVVYPNPAENILNFKSSFEISQIRVYSSDGRLIENYFINDENHVDIGGLKSGIYFVEFIASEKVIRKKIIKK